jgi:hypothetical protein
LQGTVTLHQLTNRIIGPMHRKGMDHQIMGCGLQRKRVIIGDCREIRPKAGKTCHHHWGCEGSVNLLQSFLNFGHDLFVQK